MTKTDLKFKVNEEWSKAKQENPWMAHIPEFAEDSKGTNFMRPVGRSIVYKIVKEDEKGKQELVCNTCNSTIIGARVAHAIWDGPFPGSGSGKCHYESVPYCPKCEKEPSFHGVPIKKDFVDSIFDDLV